MEIQNKWDTTEKVIDEPQEASPTPETEKESFDEQPKGKPGLRQKRMLKRQVCVDLEEEKQDSSSESASAADDDAESGDGFVEFGDLSDDEDTKKANNKWQSNLIDDANRAPKRGTTTTQRKLTRQNVMEIDMLKFKHMTSVVIEGTLQGMTNGQQKVIGKKSVMTMHHKRGKSNSNVTSHLNLPVSPQSKKSSIVARKSVAGSMFTKNSSSPTKKKSTMKAMQ